MSSTSLKFHFLLPCARVKTAFLMIFPIQMFHASLFILQEQLHVKYLHSISKRNKQNICAVYCMMMLLKAFFFFAILAYIHSFIQFKQPTLLKHLMYPTSLFWGGSILVRPSTLSVEVSPFACISKLSSILRIKVAAYE